VIPFHFALDTPNIPVAAVRLYCAPHPASRGAFVGRVQIYYIIGNIRTLAKHVVRDHAAIYIQPLENLFSGLGPEVLT
jgi:hypothetical protein